MTGGLRNNKSEWFGSSLEDLVLIHPLHFGSFIDLLSHGATENDGIVSEKNKNTKVWFLFLLLGTCEKCFAAGILHRDAKWRLVLMEGMQKARVTEGDIWHPSDENKALFPVKDPDDTESVTHAYVLLHAFPSNIHICVQRDHSGRLCVYCKPQEARRGIGVPIKRNESHVPEFLLLYFSFVFFRFVRCSCPPPSLPPFERTLCATRADPGGTKYVSTLLLQVGSMHACNRWLSLTWNLLVVSHLLIITDHPRSPWPACACASAHVTRRRLTGLLRPVLGCPSYRPRGKITTKLQISCYITERGGLSAPCSLSGLL